jgi:hypothetical protein
VGAYPSAPKGTWRIELLRDTGQSGALGFHADSHHQPYAKVDVDTGQWTVTASHELLEMLGDPWGNRLHGAAALPGWEGTSRRVRYLVELCDPCEAFTYPVGGVELSDFLLPNFYRSSPRATAGYSHLGRLTEPLQIADGGYISFLDPADGHVWQALRPGRAGAGQGLGGATVRRGDAARTHRRARRRVSRGSVVTAPLASSPPALPAGRPVWPGRPHGPAEGREHPQSAVGPFRTASAA